MFKERWRVIPDYPNYLVSNLGKVRRIGGKQLKDKPDRFGYPAVWLYNGSRESGRRIKTAWLVLMAFVGPRPVGLECCHKDRNRLNSNVDNLRWDTHSSNVLDAVGHGTHVDTSGAFNGRSKVELWDVIDMWDRYNRGESINDIAELYGLHKEYVRLVFKKKFWRHIYELVI